MNMNAPKPIDFLTHITEIESKMKRAITAHIPHQQSQPLDLLSYDPVNLVNAGHGIRAIRALDRMHGPGLDCARSLLPAAMSDGLLILIGPTGRGKTVIAAWLAAQRLKARRGAGKFLTAIALLDRIKQCWTRKEDSEPIMSAWRKTPFLVVDEVQNRSEEKWDNHLFDDLINARYSNELPTVLIANLTLTEAQKSLGPRIMDRANEAGGIVDCNWKSYR
jgi:DNA replication protein DnaC